MAAVASHVAAVCATVAVVSATFTAVSLTHATADEDNFAIVCPTLLTKSFAYIAHN